MPQKIGGSGPNLWPRLPFGDRNSPRRSGLRQCESSGRRAIPNLECSVRGREIAAETGVIAVTGQQTRFGVGSSSGSWDVGVEGQMGKLIVLMTATALFLCSFDVWASSSRPVDIETGPTFVISNAL